MNERFHLLNTAKHYVFQLNYRHISIFLRHIIALLQIIASELSDTANALNCIIEQEIILSLRKELQIQ